jgi:hypothetical protein
MNGSEAIICSDQRNKEFHIGGVDHSKDLIREPYVENELIGIPHPL